jgi:glycosyltransferase involved in cell wall biosynthesis
VSTVDNSLLVDAPAPHARRLRVLFVARRAWPAVGGAEMFLRQLARELAERHEVTVLARRIDDGPATRLSDSLTGPGPFEPFDDGGARIVPLGIPLPRRAALVPLAGHAVPGLRRYAWGRGRVPTARLYERVVSPLVSEHARRADVVHVWGGDMLALAAARSARSCGVPSVVTPFAHPTKYGTGPVDLLAYRSASAVVALLQADAATYRSLGVGDERLRVCGVGTHGVPAGHGARIRRRHGIEGPLVVFLGVRRGYKGLELMLEAAPLVKRAVPGVTFAVLGPGEPVKSVGGARVIDAGFVSDADRAGWLEAATLLCLPSEAEIFPVSMLEAWSVGTGIVTSDIPPLRELADLSGGSVTAPREAGLLAGAIAGLLASPDRARALGEAGHAFWRNGHTVAAIAGRHEELYASLAARSRRFRA